MLKFYTASMSTKTDLPIIDVTVANKKEKVFSPTWSMVMDFKKGSLSEEDYTEMYYEHMRESHRLYRSRWEEVLNMDVVVLKCFCNDDDFCHTNLLADIFVKLGATYMGRIRKEVKVFKESLQEQLEKEDRGSLAKIYTSNFLVKTPDTFILDVSSKSRSKAFAVNHGLVEDLRNRVIDEQEYANRYCEFLSKSSNEYRKEWLDLLHKDSVTIKSFGEVSEWYQPRFLLARVLENLGCTYMGEIKKER